MVVEALVDLEYFNIYYIKRILARI